MNDLSGTNKELLEEVSALKEKILALEQLVARHEQIEDDLRLSIRQLRLLIDTGPDFFFLKDLGLCYQLINSANARFFGRDESEILGRADIELMPEEPAKACRESDQLAIREKRLVVTTEHVGDRFYETYKFPVVVSGEIEGVAGIVRDITDRKRAEEALQLNAERMGTLLQLHQMTETPLQEITDFALEKAVQLTGSTVGYLVFLNEEESVLTMHSWSRNTIAECSMVQKQIHYPVMETRLWGEAVRQRRPIITNDYDKPDPSMKGYPAGHIRIFRHMDVPVFSGNRIVLVVGVGNKGKEYDLAEVQQLILLMKGMWRLIERKQTEEALKESEERFRTLFESSRDAILMMDREGKVSYWNPAAERIFGYTSVEAIGRDLHELLAPEQYREAHRAAYAQFLSMGKGEAVGKTLELQAIRKDGSDITVALSLSFEQIRDNWHSVGIIRDITEQKEAQEELKRSKSLLSSIIEFLPDAIFAINLEGKIISWNRAVEEMTGFSAETMLGKGNYEYAIPFYGERRPLFVDLLLSWDDDVAAKYSTIE
jgi:PAS domain S-box-containing protein